MVPTKNGDEELGSVSAPDAYGDQNDIPLLVESKQGSTRQFFVPLVHKIKRSSRWKMCRQWIRVPLNIAINVWIVSAVASLITLLLLSSGIMNGALPSKSQRDAWIEVDSQIVNAVFTLMCLYLHPRRFHHLLLLCRWQPEDIFRLREVYCMNGTEKPNERKHMLVVVILLHINCFAQYVTCGFTVGYPNSTQRTVRTMPCIVVAIAAGVISGSYIKRSPLGKDYDTGKDRDAQDRVTST